MTQKVVTRFAPSPTGSLHIGGLRTALFSYLLAKSQGGKFILRVEDTDQNRLVEDSVKEITDSLKWAGLDWDEGPIFQSSRLEHYQSYANKLLEDGNAYRCFCSSERLEKVREEKIAKKENPGYDRLCRNLSQEQVDKNIANGEKFVVRIKTPIDGSITATDLLRGEMELKFDQIEDMVILKTDGFPTYHLAHVVDDSMMEVSHILRGTEWIPTTPVHAFMFKSLDLKPPLYVHLPLILSADGGKLSKRDGATNVKEFIEQGYTKESLINFLVLLGWSLDDKTEFFTLAELEKCFDAKRISKSPAVFSYDKLNFFNNAYIKKMAPSEVFELSKAYFSEPFLNSNLESLKGLVGLYQDRLETISEVSKYLEFYHKPDQVIITKDLFEFKKFGLDISQKSISACINALESINEWSLENVNASLSGAAESNGLKKPQIFMPLRVALTGTSQTPSIGDIVYYVGKEFSLIALNSVT